jgi:hypothetical protein
MWDNLAQQAPGVLALLSYLFTIETLPQREGEQETGPRRRARTSMHMLEVSE